MPPDVVAYLLALLTVGIIVLIATGLLYFFAPARFQEWFSDGIRQQKLARGELYVFILVYIVVYLVLTFYRHRHFHTAGYDLAIEDQVVWNTAHGRWYGSSIEVRNFLGDHFSPLIALLAPFYWLKPTVYWLLGFQTIALALGAVPVFRLALRRLQSPMMAAGFALVYLLYPSVGTINLFDFHWEATVIPLLLAAVEAADRENWRAMSVWLVLALVGKEEIGLTIGLFGLWLALRKREYRWGLGWMATGLVYSFVVLLVLIPFIRMEPSDTLERYAWLGDSPAAIVARMISEPGLILGRWLGWDAFRYFLRLVAPVLFLSLFSSQLLLILPAASYNLLSSFPPQNAPYFQYVAPMVPFVISSAIYGAAWLIGRVRAEKRWRLAAGLLFGLLCFVGLHNAIVGTATIFSERLDNEAAVWEGLASVPADASVFTTNYYGPHLAHRQTLYVYYDVAADRDFLLRTDVTFLNLHDMRSARAGLSCEDYVFWLKLAQTHDYGVVFYQNGVVVLQREEGDVGQIDDILAGECRSS